MNFRIFSRVNLFIRDTDKIFFEFPNKSLRLNCYSTSQPKWPDLQQICNTGNIPDKFNFATHIFEKHVTNRPEHTALWFDDGINERKITYRQFRSESVRAALAINDLVTPNSYSNAKLRIPPIVMVMLPRVPEWWFLHLGSIRAGTIFCPATVLLTVDDIKFRLQVSRAKIVVTNEENMEKIDEAQSQLGKFDLKKIVVGLSPQNKSLPKGWFSYEDVVRSFTENQEAAFKDVDTKSDDLSQVYFTSGSTGRPKMVAHTHSSYSIGHYNTAEVCDIRESDLVWSPGDTGWAKCAYCSFYASFAMGATVYVHQMERIEPKKILETLCTKPISFFFSPPTMFRSMLQENDTSLFHHKTVRNYVSGGEAVNPEVIRAWRKKTGKTVKVIYGQTEMTAVGEGDALSQKAGYFGNPQKQYDMSIVNSDGEECKVGEEGFIGLKVNPKYPIGLFKGYLQEGPNGPEWDEGKHKTCFVGDFYVTGDKGYVDENGKFFYLSRPDDIIKSSGYRIGPFEVESALQTHPAVVESAVVASPDSLRGEVVKAFVVLTEKVKSRKDLDIRRLVKELQEHVKSQTAPYKYPRKVEFVHSLPKTVTGKILRRELKQLESSLYFPYEELIDANVA